MSRIGKMPVVVPPKVKVSLNNGRLSAEGLADRRVRRIAGRLLAGDVDGVRMNVRRWLPSTTQATDLGLAVLLCVLGAIGLEGSVGTSSAVAAGASTSAVGAHSQFGFERIRSFDSTVRIQAA